MEQFAREAASAAAKFEDRTTIFHVQVRYQLAQSRILIEGLRVEPRPERVVKASGLIVSEKSCAIHNRTL